MSFNKKKQTGTIVCNGISEARLLSNYIQMRDDYLIIKQDKDKLNYLINVQHVSYTEISFSFEFNNGILMDVSINMPQDEEMATLGGGKIRIQNGVLPDSNLKEIMTQEEINLCKL